MLFVIDESLANALDGESGSVKNSAIEAISLIAQAHREGNHLIYAERITLDKIMSYSSLFGPRTVRIYEKILDNLPTQRSYFNAISRYIEVVADANVLEVRDERIKERCIKVIRLSSSYIRIPLVSKTKILGENETDIKFYEKIAQTYLSWNRLGNIKLSYLSHGGGGDTTATAYKTIQETKEQLCLCIADSDREFPDDKEGVTAKKLIDIDVKFQSPLCKLLILDVREIENLIPISIYKKAVCHKEQKETITILEKLESSTIPNIRNARKYLDIKKGLKLWRFFHASSSKEFLAYWKSVLVELKIQFVCTLPTSEEQCNGDKDKCQCIAINGLGSQILGEVIKALAEKIKRREEIVVCKSLEEEWKNIGEMIISWCCGSPHIST